MQRFFIIITVAAGLLYSYEVESKVQCSTFPAAAYDLKVFEESAEEFNEQFNPGVLDIDLILGSVYEFLENSFPGQSPQVPTLTQNNTVNTSLFMPDYVNHQEVFKKSDRLLPAADYYCFILPPVIFHPPQA